MSNIVNAHNVLIPKINDTDFIKNKYRILVIQNDMFLLNLKVLKTMT